MFYYSLFHKYMWNTKFNINWGQQTLKHNIMKVIDITGLSVATDNLFDSSSPINLGGVGAQPVHIKQTMVGGGS